MLALLTSALYAQQADVSGVVKDSSGRIWFSVNGAVVVVDPARLANSDAPAIANISPSMYSLLNSAARSMRR